MNPLGGGGGGGSGGKHMFSGEYLHVGESIQNQGIRSLISPHVIVAIDVIFK
jgi:hypothetical protein